MRHTDPYLPADKLGIPEGHRQVLIELARDLTDSIIPASEWNMESWQSCICHHMENRGVNELPIAFGSLIYRLYTPPWTGKPQREITQPEAAKACYNFLTTGDPHWREACEAEYYTWHACI